MKRWYTVSQTQPVSGSPAATPAITIDTSSYEASVRNLLQDLADWSNSRRQSLSNFSPDIAMVQSVLSRYQYQNLPALIAAISGNDEEAMQQSMYAVWDFEKQINKSHGWQAAMEINKVSRHIRDCIERLEMQTETSSPYTPEEIERTIAQLTQQTWAEMEKISRSIQEAVSRIGNWNGSPILIRAADAHKESNYMSDPSDSAQIELGRDDMAPNFSYFSVGDGKIEIDDVLDAGDEDFFTSPTQQSDYFNLIKELKNPGSTSRGGKVLTLFTARPVKDRDLYMNANQVPSNIFLTNNYNSAIGLAGDLAGSEPRRDVWRLRIDSRYLLQTLDGPEKQYQVVGEGTVPVQSLALVDEGEAAPQRQKGITVDSRNRSDTGESRMKNIFKLADFTEMRSDEKAKHTHLDGLEGPFKFKNGRVLYWDPSEQGGMWYDLSKDMYVDNTEATEADAERPQPVSPQAANPYLRNLRETSDLGKRNYTGLLNNLKDRQGPQVPPIPR